VRSGDRRRTARNERPDLVALGADQLSPIEKRTIDVVRSTFDDPRADRVVRWCQRTLGSRWITFLTRNLRHVYGLERLPELDPSQSYICVSNHRSFFDLYVVTGTLVARGLPHRIVFPVRSNFFYEGNLGLFVNGVMSFFAMYPPVFRQRERAALNVASRDEVIWLLKRGGAFCGIHPEGTRKKDDDPYTFLPAQSGVGRIIHHARVPVIPVFVNGLGNDFTKQIAGDITKKGQPITVVFGEPIDFRTLLDEPPSPRLYKRISERTLEAIGELGAEEREIRKTLVR
jgi:1-acyl-sn-glycerol-3-phosphate acyltransferase